MPKKRRVDAEGRNLMRDGKATTCLCLTAFVTRQCQFQMNIIYSGTKHVAKYANLSH